jgi:Tfp pilus assembly protein PilV
LTRHLVDQRGVSLLVEVMVGALLLSLAIIPIFTMLSASLLVLERSKVVTVATHLLQDRSEVIKAAGYSYASVDPLNVTVHENYEGFPFDITEQITYVSTMADVIGVPQVKKVVLSIYRHPVSPSDIPLLKWEFLLYASGV